MLTHIGSDNQPSMVDVGEKSVTHRIARARAVVELPAEVLRLFDDREIVSPKGPVFQTAVIAGTMAAKKTADLIPLCHPIPIENCHIDIEVRAERVVIECTVSVHHKTGVEMEALTGAGVAALTVYDMCKGVSRDMRIVEIALVEKKGGRSDRGAAGESR